MDRTAPLPFYRRWWFWLLLAIIALVLFSLRGGLGSEPDLPETPGTEEQAAP